MRGFCALLCTWLLAVPAAAADLALLNRIADEGFNHSRVAETAEYLTDVIGPRLTNSPAIREAERWTQQRFREWGLRDVRAEGFDFGRGWTHEGSSVTMLAPRRLQLRGIPITWTPGTNGAISAPIVVAPIKAESDFEAWRGKLTGRIVLITAPADPKDDFDIPFQRRTAEELTKLDQYVPQPNDPKALDRMIESRTFPLKLDAFLKGEGALAWARMSRRDNGLVHGDGATFHVGRTPSLPGFEIAAEDYRRLARLARRGPVQLELESRVRFDDSDPNAYNILADIPGTEPKSGYVMAGAHLDSWAAGDGAGDNGAGSAVVMEAARILSTLGVKPKRGIRFALWAGEEQGLRGSFAYTEEHLATRPPNPDPAAALVGGRSRSFNYPVSPKPGYRDMAAYFNVDGGAGRIRGVFGQSNFAAIPLLKEWFSPLASLGASTVVIQPIDGTDHVPMAQIGLPAFQFIHDNLDLWTRTHHTNVDTFDHLRVEDLKHSAVILASVLYAAAQSEERIPRNVLPTAP